MSQGPMYSNYPREGMSMFGNYPPGVYFEFIGKAWEMVKTNLGMWMVSTLVVGLIFYGLSFAMSFAVNMVAYGSMMGPQMQPGATPELSTIYTPMFVIMSILSNAIQGGITSGLIVGMVLMALDQLNGVPLRFRVFEGFQNFLPLMIAAFLVSLVTQIGTLLCCIPGFWLTGALAFVPFYVGIKGMGPVAGFQASLDTLKPYAFPMFGLILVLSLMTGVSAICCVIPVLAVAPIAVMVMAMHWTVFNPTAPQAAAYGPASGPAAGGGMYSNPYEPPTQNPPSEGPYQGPPQG